MKVVLEIKTDKELTNDDIIVSKNGCWQITSKEAFLSKIKEAQRNTKQELLGRIERLEKNLVELAKIIKEK